MPGMFKKIFRYFIIAIAAVNLIPILCIGLFSGTVVWFNLLYFAFLYPTNQGVQFQGEIYERQYGQYTLMPTEYAWEMAIPEKVFLKMAQQEDWAVWPVTEPVKILRYNFAKSDSDIRQVIDAKPQDETSESPYHIIQHGYFYAFDGARSFTYSLHVGYDSDNGKMYFYKHARGPGYTFRELNPDRTLPEQPIPFLPADPFAF